MSMKLLAGAAVAAALLAGGPASAQDKDSQAFLKEAIEGNLAEVQMGQLAEKNGMNPSVKQFGQMLQKDHADANQKAKTAAAALKVAPPTQPTAKQKANYDKMAKLKGAEFDKAFAQDMVTDHENDIKAYEKESAKSDDAGKYAKDALPTLRKHLETAQSLGNSTTGSR